MNSTLTAELGRERYDGVAIWLHWLTVLLVLSLWGIAQGWGFLPKHSAGRHGLQALHVSLGLCFAVVIVLRIVWRLSHAAPPPPPGLLGVVSRGVHFLLYVLLVAMIPLGLANRWLHDDPMRFFGLFTIPSPVAPGKALADQVNDVHGTVAMIILILAGLHALAALYHHFIRHDGILRRMLPRRA